MQQLYLTGNHAGNLAGQLFTALNVRPVGCRLTPFEVDGSIRGEAMHLLLPPAPPLHNDVPCRLLLAPGRWAVVPEVLEEIAAPGLTAARGVHAPMLLSGLTKDVLRCRPFREAVAACLAGSRPVVVAAARDAAAVLKKLTPAEDQLWFDVPDDRAGQAALLETLVPEAVLRF